MKTNLSSMRMSVAMFIAVSLYASANSQTMLIENFNYVSGSALTSNGWASHSGTGNNPVASGSPGLVFEGYASSNIGLSALLVNDGEDVNKSFTSVTTGNVFCAFLIKVNSVTNDYFLHLSNSGVSANRGRIFIKGTGNSFSIGLSKGAETASYTPDSPYSTGTTYLLVLKYSIIDGTSNDVVSLYIFTGSIPAAEPSLPTVGPLNEASQSDLANVSAVALRQYSTSQNTIIDGIRIAQKWDDAVGITTGKEYDLNEYSPAIYPVPANNYLTITNIAMYNTIEIIESSGKVLILEKNDNETEKHIRISDLHSGLYIIKLRSPERVKTMKFIKL